MTTTTAIEATIPQRKRDSLYAISQEFDALEALLEEAEAGATEADADVVAQFLEELDGRLEDKLRGCIAWSRDHLALADAAASEAKRLMDLAAKRKANVERLKATIRKLFEEQRIARIDTALGAVRLVQNGGKDPVLLADTFKVEALPDDCKKTVVSPIKDAIRAHLEAGEVIEGATIGQRGKRVDLG